MKKILIGSGVSEKCSSALEKKGYTVIKLPPYRRLQTPVASHADMLVFYDGKELLTFEDYYNSESELFLSLGVKITAVSELPGEQYPYDILLNAVLTDGGVLFSKSSHTALALLGKADRTVTVKQGYTACSTCRVTDGAFITTDEGLFKAYTNNKIDCLLVGKEGISLPGYDCGFIGGATLVTEGEVCFFGRAEDHPDYSAMKSFVEKYGKVIVSLSDEKLTDVGGAVVI